MFTSIPTRLTQYMTTTKSGETELAFSLSGGDGTDTFDLLGRSEFIEDALELLKVVVDHIRECDNEHGIEILDGLAEIGNADIVIDEVTFSHDEIIDIIKSEDDEYEDDEYEE